MWELCCSLAMPIDGTVLGNVFGGAECFKGKTFKSRFLCPFFFPLSYFLYLSLSLAPSLFLSLSCGFCLDWVLADVKDGFTNCNFLDAKKDFVIL